MATLVWNGSAWVIPSLPAYDGSAYRVGHFDFYDGATWLPEDNPALAAGITIESVAYWDVADPTPDTQTYTATKNFAPSWSATYRGDNSKRNDTTDLVQGYYSSNGNQKALIGFNVTGLPAGATCVSAKLILTANSWWFNSGGTAVIGTHNKASEPGTYSSSGVNDDRLSPRPEWTTKSGTKTINLGTTIGNEFISGSTKGIILGPGPTNSTTYYGRFSSVGSDKPILQIKYSWEE